MATVGKTINLKNWSELEYEVREVFQFFIWETFLKNKRDPPPLPLQQGL